MARPGISLSVQYGSDGLACFMLLESPRMLFTSEQAKAAYYAHTKEKQRPPPSSMESNTITEVLAEVVPLPSRGMELDQRIREVAGTRVRVDDYENVLKMHTLQSARQRQHKRKQRVTVLVKRDVCSKQSK